MRGVSWDLVPCSSTNFCYQKPASRPPAMRDTRFSGRSSATATSATSSQPLPTVSLSVGPFQSRPDWFTHGLARAESGAHHLASQPMRARPALRIPPAPADRTFRPASHGTLSPDLQDGFGALQTVVPSPHFVAPTRRRAQPFAHSSTHTFPTFTSLFIYTSIALYTIISIAPSNSTTTIVVSSHTSLSSLVVTVACQASRMPTICPLT